MLSLLLLIASSGASAAATSEIAAPDPKSMSRAEIKAHNAKLSSNHPYYIRCKRSADTGTLIARTFSCRTNAQWQASEEGGNREARSIMDEMTTKSAVTTN